MAGHTSLRHSVSTLRITSLCALHPIGSVAMQEEAHQCSSSSAVEGKAGEARGGVTHTSLRYSG